MGTNERTAVVLGEFGGLGLGHLSQFVGHVALVAHDDDGHVPRVL